MDRRLGLLALTVAVAAGLGALALSSTGSPTPRGLMLADAPALALLIGWSFAGAGVVASVLRPHNRFGLLLYGTGLMWFTSALMASDRVMAEDHAEPAATRASSGVASLLIPHSSIDVSD